MSYRLGLIHLWRKLPETQKQVIQMLWEWQENWNYNKSLDSVKRNTVDKLAEIGLVDQYMLPLTEEKDEFGDYKTRKRVIRLTERGMALAYFVNSDWWMSTSLDKAKAPTRDKVFIDSSIHIIDTYRHALVSDEIVVSEYGPGDTKTEIGPSTCVICQTKYVASTPEDFTRAEIPDTKRHFELPSQLMDSIGYLCELQRRAKSYSTIEWAV